MNNEKDCETEQTLYLSYDKNFIVRSVSTSPVVAEGQTSKRIVGDDNLRQLVGRKVPYDMLDPQDFNIKDTSELRVAVVCNWNDKCGISTYTGYLVEAMKGKVAEMRIFSEHTDDQTQEDEEFVERCWTRGESLLPLAEQILDWNPDFVIIQHEFGIFPNAFRFMQFTEALNGTPYVVAMHSVYEHLDKLVYTEACKNIIVHSKDAKETLERLGNTRQIDVIPHGCITADETDELWNIMRSPYTIMQFGFGFEYKGVERAIQAVAHLKRTDPKFENLFYFFLWSTNSHNLATQSDYYDKLIKLAEEEGVRDNIAILKKYQSERMLNLYLRLAKMVVFPYVVNGDNKVYGASGAIRIAMAHGKPVVASDSHLFDDLEGVIPRPKDHLELAQVIDEIFSDDERRNEVVRAGINYVQTHSWDYSADRYLELYAKIMRQNVTCI
tara:strand:- start:1208 stop:2527 length:1320 start_codon:yes stop_codon:yes gene_type:complete